MKGIFRAIVWLVMMFVPVMAQAGFTEAKNISTGGRKTLYNNSVYILKSSETVNASSGLSAYKVDDNSTVVLYIPAGRTLTLQGGTGSGVAPAGAGIEVPSNSTLIITGEGTLDVTGGPGAVGGSGDSGGGVTLTYDKWQGGPGGKGGYGGGGAGAAIGGVGGAGGAGGSGGRSWEADCSYYGEDTNGESGSGGSSGSAGKNCGTVYLLGSIEVIANAGAKGNGGASGSRGPGKWDYWTHEFHVGSGGGGGGGGGGGAPVNAIGGGGAGGGGGGGGGAGGRFSCNRGGNPGEPSGAGGRGGYGASDNTGNGWSDSPGKADYMVDGPIYGGSGGSGGSCGGTSSSGTIYKDTSVSISGTSQSFASATTHPAIEYTIRFNDGWRLSATKTVRLGYTLPAAPVTSRYGYYFKGWFSDVNGGGTQYYDANGNAVIDVWSRTQDVTLYPGWEVNEHESLSEVELVINGTTICEGTDAYGAGWSYSAVLGRIDITGDDTVYNISGKDLHGFAQIIVNAHNPTIKITQQLKMASGGREGYTPITIMSGGAATLEVSTEQSDEAMCDLNGGDGRTAIAVQTGATLTLKTDGWLGVTGGAGAADIGLNKDETVCGDIYVETYQHWFARIRPGHGLSDSNGLENNRGKSAKFISTVTGETVWSVRMTGLVSGPIYRQRVSSDIHDYVQPDFNGDAWFWLPQGGCEWGNKRDASLSREGDIIWICYVESKHSIAEVFYPLYVEIDGEDIAHLTGNGWYSELEGSTGGVVEGTKATLVITNAGPHVVSGYGNASVEIMCDTALTISNLTLNTSSWNGKCAMTICDRARVDLTVVDEDTSLVSGFGSPGIAVYADSTLNIDGNGYLAARGGMNAAGIGGKNGVRSGTINISGGIITAIGGENAAGIGGANTEGQGGDINITGGIVTARGGQNGAAIGGGRRGYSNVTISGGTVYPTAGNNAKAIGIGYNSDASVPVATIFGWAAIFDTGVDDVQPRAVDASRNAVFPVTFDVGVAQSKISRIIIDREEKPCNDLWTDESGRLVLWLKSTGGKLHTITISVDNGEEEVKKSWGYEVDDTGRYEFSRDVITVDGEPIVGGIDAGGGGWNYDSASGIMMFTTGNHEISGASTNGTIRIIANGDDVGIKLSKLTLMTPNSYLSPFVISNSCTLTLDKENTIECIYNPDAKYTSQYGSCYTAAIEVPEGASLTINGSGTLTAHGGIYGAGIGSRGVGGMNAGSIRIDGGYVYAMAGSHNKNGGGGAGIGGGNGGSVASILITGGYVDATGGRGACGIGGGNGKAVILTNGTFRVTGGTVLASKGAGNVQYDFLPSSGNVLPVTGGSSKYIVIDGPCSVRPKNATTVNSCAYPTPVNSNGVRLVFAMIGGLGAGDKVRLVDEFWQQYTGVDVIADDDGTVCLWGEYTNAVRSIQIESPNTPGGSVTFELSAATNSIYKLSDDYEAPDKCIVDGKDCWRVEVKALPARKRLQVTGIEPPFSRGTTVSDSTGMTYLYLPDGEYDFTVGGLEYHASVNGAPTVATFTVGILVDGVDIGECSGAGWTYNGTLEILSLTSATEYLISGTNTDRRVSVSVETEGVKIRADRLELRESSRGAFYSNSDILFEFAGGTVSTGFITSRMLVSGGSIISTVLNPVAKAESGEGCVSAYRVSVGTYTRYAKLEITDIEGLGDYDTEDIYADKYGRAYLYLPNGDYWFRVADGATTNEMIAIVEDGEITALNYTPTGVYINGREAARLRGSDEGGTTLWRNESGMVHLLASTNYVISGTNDGEAISFTTEHTKISLVLDNLVMTNALMMASPITIGRTNKSSYTIELEGTNILHGIAEGACGVEMRQLAELTIEGGGRLEAIGIGPGIGVGSGEISDATTVIVNSGEVIATGGENSAGIGGGDGQGGLRTYIYGGTVTATGGANAAGIGGGKGMNGADVVITNGTIVAIGGAGGAGIGGGRGGSGNTGTEVCMITGGIVTATGGEGASGIGGGSGGDDGRYRQLGGTVVPRGGTGCDNIGAGNGGSANANNYVSMLGGSLNSPSSKISNTPKGSDGNQVYCVTVPTGRPNFNVGAVMHDYNGYSLNGVVTDDEGNIYIWLGNGEYYMNIGNTPFRAVVDGADTVAEEWYVGVEVDGNDVALQAGDGWTYDVYSHVLSLKKDNCVLSGTNTEGRVFLDCTDNLVVAVSNLVLSTSSTQCAPIEIASNVTANVKLIGDNEFTSSGYGVPAIRVPYSSTLTITNIDTVVTLPDLDKIEYYTNIVESVEEIEDEHGDIVIVTNNIEIVTVITNYYDVSVSPTLIASAEYSASAIGGGYSQSHGTIEIFGGVIEATGGSGSAAIGSGEFSAKAAEDDIIREGEVKIYGGKVTAEGGRYGAGIGGGIRHTGGEITILGGEVEAKGNSGGTGLGGGSYERGYRVTISGGSVTAEGGSNGAGIGGGDMTSVVKIANPTLVSISGGRVTANGGISAAGIGGGCYDIFTASVNITGGTIVAKGGLELNGDFPPDDIGFGATYSSTKSSFKMTIKGASVHAMHRTDSSSYITPAASNGTERVYCVTVQTAQTNELVNVAYIESQGFTENSSIYADEKGKIYLWLPDGTHIFYVDEEPRAVTVNGADTTADVWQTGVTVDGTDVAFVSGVGERWYYDYGRRSLFIIEECVISGTNTDGYVNIIAGPLEGKEEGGGEPTLELTISNLYLKTTRSISPFTATNGLVRVALAGLNMLDASGVEDYAGMAVAAQASLTITNMDDVAYLTAMAGGRAAAIGGSYNSPFANLRIEGGRISATTHYEGAGIGTGTGSRASCDSICISGGTISAIGSGEAAGIGTGKSGKCNKIEISGGYISATAGNGGGAGIGSSYNSTSVKTINISGGEILARGSNYGGAGIGSGAGSGGTSQINISGGNITAFGGDNYGGAGIGGGNASYEVDITVSGGQIRAYGGVKGGAGIGSGLKGQCGNIVISGGKINAYGGWTKGSWSWTSYAGAGIGAGDSAYAATKTINITGGTVYAAGKVLEDDIYSADIGDGLECANGGRIYTTRITGGSIFPARVYDTSIPWYRQSGSYYYEPPRDNSGRQVFKVTIPGFNLDTKVEVTMDGYGTNDIWSDNSGSIHLWLPNGTHLCTADSKRYAIRVTDGFVQMTEVPAAYGVQVDGVDVAALSGDAWSYDPFDNVLSLSGDCVLSGTNSVMPIAVNIAADIAVSPSRLQLSAATLSTTLISGDGVMTISNGTAELSGKVLCPVTILGGSLRLYTPQDESFSNAMERVYRVTVNDLQANSAVALEGLPDYYGTSGIYTDNDGLISLWLPNGDYVFSVTPEGGATRRFRAHVAGASITAEEIVPVGFTVNGVDVSYFSGEGWTYDDDEVQGRLTLQGAGPYELSGTLTNKYLNIASTCQVVLSNVVVRAHNVYGLNGIVNIAGEFDVEMTIYGENMVTTAVSKVAGIKVPENASLAISGTGTLAAYAGAYAAGIGGVDNAGCGTITIGGGTVTATGGSYGAGIGGGGEHVSSGTVSITGGVVRATGGSYSAGIGGGGDSDGGSVEISGGMVAAESGAGGGACIGAGKNGIFGDVVISGGTVVAMTDEFRTRALGDGYGTDGIGQVLITGGSVNAVASGITPVPSNSVERVFRVEIPGLVPGSKASFSGLPSNYGTDDIYADEAGKVYLWLPAGAWITSPFSSNANNLSWHSAPDTTQVHNIVVNGIRYVIYIDEENGTTEVVEEGPAELETIAINSFTIENDVFHVNYTVKPDTWINGFIEKIELHGSANLSDLDDDSTILPLDNAEVKIIDNRTAILSLPLGENHPYLFFKLKEANR